MAHSISSSSSSAWCNTELKVVKFDFTWTIRNFLFCGAEVGDQFESPTFSADPNDVRQPKWHLRVYPRGKEEWKGHLGVYLCLDERNKMPLPTNFQLKFALLNEKREQTHAKESDIGKIGSKCSRGVGGLYSQTAVPPNNHSMVTGRGNGHLRPSDSQTLFY